MSSTVVRRQHIVRADAARLVLFARGHEIASWPIPADEPPDLELVDALAHWQLTAQRGGYDLRVRTASRDLLDLLDLVGLRDVLVADDENDDVGGLQMCGQTERLEQAGIEEIVQPDDPAV